MERPSYTRHDTDAVTTEEKGPYGTTTSVEASSKEGSITKAQEAGVLELPPYHDAADADAEAAFRDGNVKNDLDTAEDIVTTVIHVDDDPSLNPWTFRMFFIGKKIESRRTSKSNGIQGSVYPPSVLSCKRSSTSSPKLFTFPSCS
jgi:hypothetical protein